MATAAGTADEGGDLDILELAQPQLDGGARHDAAPQKVLFPLQNCLYFTIKAVCWFIDSPSF
jgi:hypothetical protein